MKKVLASSVVVLMVFLLSTGLGLAGNGKGGGNGNGGGGGYCGGTGLSLVCAGAPVTITGTVSQESYLGSGLQIDTGATEDPIVTVYGIGPYWFWEDIARPSIGEEVTVEGMNVTFSDGSTKIIVMSITVGDKTIDLRAACVAGVGGWPLWRGSRNSN
jgi:hypothetical protein